MRLEQLRATPAMTALAPRGMVDTVFDRVPTIPTRYVHVPAGAGDATLEIKAGGPIWPSLRRPARRRKRVQYPRMGRPSLNVGTIEGGTVPNMVPNWCRIGVDRRLIPGETKEQAIAEITDVIDGLRRPHPKLDAVVAERIWWPGYMLEDGEPIVTIGSPSSSM